MIFQTFHIYSVELSKGSIKILGVSKRHQLERCSAGTPPILKSPNRSADVVVFVRSHLAKVSSPGHVGKSRHEYECTLFSAQRNANCFPNRCLYTRGYLNLWISATNLHANRSWSLASIDLSYFLQGGVVVDL